LALHLPGIPVVLCLGNQRLQRALVLPVACGPIEAVVPATRAHKLLCVDATSSRLLLALEIIGLGVNISQPYPDRGDLIAANTPVDNLLRALARVERPPLRSSYDRERQRPTICADLKHHVVCALRHEDMSCIV
jgi:hypothetical protein